MKFLFFIFSITSSFSLFAQDSVFRVGETTILSTGDTVPRTVEGTLWRITGTIAKPTMAVGGMMGGIEQKYQAQVVELTRTQAGESFNRVEVGGYLKGSAVDGLVLNVIKVDAEGKPYVQSKLKYVILLKDTYIVGQTNIEVRNIKNLPPLHDGYEWKEVSRVKMATMIDPETGRSFGDRVTYSLHKIDSSKPNSFEVPRIESAYGTSQAEAIESAKRRGLFSIKNAIGRAGRR